MLKKQYRLKKEQDFQRVFKKGKSIFDPICGIKFLKNDLEESRFGFAVGVKVHKSAVKRNRIKRQYRAIIKDHLVEIKDGFDILLLTSKKTLEMDFVEKEKALIKTLKKANLLK